MRKLQPRARQGRLIHGDWDMRSLPKSSLLIEFQQNLAGLIADLAILVLFVILLAVH